MRKFETSWLAFAVAAAFGTPPAGAQMWFDTAAIMQPVVLNPCPAGHCPGVHGADSEERQDQSEHAGTPRASAADLVYTSSAQRRRTNLAHFVSQTRRQNAESASAMEKLFTSTDILGKISGALTPYNFSIENVGDAYAFWWMTAWEGAQGSNRAFSRGEMHAVQSQAHRALASAPKMMRATDTQKQEMAEALWIQAAMIDSMVDLAKQQPDLMPQLQQSIRRGASASGVDLDAMRLTADGFVSR